MATPSLSGPARTSTDRCPGVLRPWIADDGALVRLRLIGGELSTSSLDALRSLAADHGDGDLHLTRRANLQVRALPHDDGVLAPALVERFAATGLLPAPDHELVRNVLVSPLTGRLGGRADLRPVAAALDAGLVADPAFASLAARFLFVLDDGRGDVAGRALDLGLVALDDDTVQLRFGSHGWGRVVPLAEAPDALLVLARRFVERSGSGPSAPWHVDELDSPLAEEQRRDPRTTAESPPPPPGRLTQHDGRTALHVDVPGGVLTPERADTLPTVEGGRLVVTPWRSVIVPDLARQEVAS